MITLQQFGFTYAGDHQPALQELNLNFAPGEFTVIAGANGAGKTSLCRALTGFIPHFYTGRQHGSLTLNGVESAQLPLGEMTRQVGFVFQNPVNQLSGARFTVYEEVAFGLENLGMAPVEMPARIERALAQTGLHALAGRSPYQLSGGQQQRLALASILVMQPAWLVLDEPTTLLDPAGRAEVLEVLTDLHRSGTSILIATHDFEHVLPRAGRLILLEGGRVVADGTPLDVLTAPGSQLTGPALPRLLRAAQALQQAGRWPADAPLPLTAAQAEAGFGRVLKDRGRHA
jgi:energy-coupling factor transporter ATP-binding protein EcfA2